MRFRHSDGTIVHLGYCTNVHPAEDLDGIIEQLGRYSEPVRKALGVETLGVGLWIPAEVAALLANDEKSLERLRDELTARSLEVVTLNGFPYKSFHAVVVKHDVYKPDWTDPQRLEYTMNLARVLQGLLPRDVETGSISTLPIGWRDLEVGDEAINALKDLGRQLDALSGPKIRVAVEPEPGCSVETVEHAAEVLAEIDSSQVGLCLDACHLAVQFEDAATAATQLDSTNVAIVKAQLSAALRAETPHKAEWLSSFVEPRFLHQTRERSQSGDILDVDDLDQALNQGLPGNSEWRIHFHVPLHIDDGRTTQDELRDTLRVLVGGDNALTHHLEVETYTWTVLPEADRPTDDASLIAGIAKELAWTANELTKLGLTLEQ